MAPILPLCDLTLDASLFDCTHRYPLCINPSGFQFPALWTITQAIGQCASDSRLLDSSSASISLTASSLQPLLTQAACEAIIGVSWTLYPASDIWNRLTAWKFPLLQLVAIFPRPPLGFAVSTFSIVHHLGNPVGTLKNLLLKIASCQARADYWIALLEEWPELTELNTEDRRPNGEFADQEAVTIEKKKSLHYARKERTWKALAILMDSYDEWGMEFGDEARTVLTKWLTSPDLSHADKHRLLRACHDTADALAADRSTKFLPIAIALAFFIGAIGLAVGRTESATAGPNATTFINIEAHSIAFSSLYFWIIATTILAAFIGSSQTEENMPRILEGLRKRMQPELMSTVPEHLAAFKLPRPGLSSKDGIDFAFSPATRIHNGGIYAWYPEPVRTRLIAELRRSSAHTHRPRPSPSYSPRLAPPSPSRGRSVLHSIFRLRPGSITCAVTVVLSCLLTGLLISALVPPVGFGCRCVGEVLITATWLLNAAMDYVPLGRRWQFSFAFTKDCIVTLATMLGIVATQIGVFNRCSCYTAWGTAGLALPEVDFVAAVLQWGITMTYPAIAFLNISMQLLLFPLWVYVQYPEAMRVFLQRDDGRSNRWQWWRLRDTVGRRCGYQKGRGSGSRDTVRMLNGEKADGVVAITIQQVV